MEDNKKKNVAVEKVEKITGDKTKNTPTTAQVKKDKKQNDSDKSKQRKLQREERRKQAEKRRAEKKAKEEARKAKRIEEAKKRQEKREDLARLKLERKTEKQKRRDAIKHETVKERQRRLASEKAEKAKIKKERLEKKAEIRKQKVQAKIELKKAKNLQKAERKKARHGYGGFIAAVISLGCAVLILVGVIGAMFFFGSPINNNSMLNALYGERFYDLVSYVEEMDVKLSKLSVSNDSEEQQILLNGLTVDSNLAVNNLSALPLKDESRYYTTKFINQVGDYSNYLSEKLIKGGSLSEEDRENLDSIYTINANLLDELSTLSNKLGENYEFKDLLNDGDVILEKFEDLEQLAVTYPQMIYDGPFSDGLDEREAKALGGVDEISMEEAGDKFVEYFADYKVSDVKYLGDGMGKYFDCYNFTGKDENGVEVFAKITKKGGYLAEFNYYKLCEKTNFDLDTCVEIAQDFLEDIGVTDMKPVWYNADGKEVTINFAYENGDIIFYPDLIKVNVCQERGVVNGIEATNYILNHTERRAGEEQLTETEALENVSQNIDVESIRLCVIPVGSSNEKLAYEFSGKYNGNVYYIYVDAVTGKELDIFKVVETTEGTLLV